MEFVKFEEYQTFINQSMQLKHRLHINNLTNCQKEFHIASLPTLPGYN